MFADFFRQVFKGIATPQHVYAKATNWQKPAAISAALLCAAGFYWGLFVAPMDAKQGQVVRIIYIHVPLVLLGQAAMAAIGLFGVATLVWRVRVTRVLARALAPLALAAMGLGIVTGAIWGYPTWGTFWVWDARLTSTLVLFLILAGWVGLANSSRSERTDQLCAILSIVGVIDIPVIQYSVEWWNTLHQGATFTLTEKPKMPASMYLPLLVCTLGVLITGIALWLQRIRTEALLLDAHKPWVAEIVSGKRLDSATSTATSRSISAE